MSNFTVNDIDRKLLREQIKRKMLTEARKNLAQKVIEERYEKGITAISVFDIFDKSEIKNIVEFAQNNLDEVKLAAKVLREQVYSGQLTNSENKVNQVLSSDVELKGQKIRLHEVSDFALDMLFGFGPMLGLVPVPGFELAGSGIAIAGLLYYGYKLYQAVRSGNGVEIFIQGIAVLFAASAVFPRVGAAVAAGFRGVFAFFKGFGRAAVTATVAVKTGGLSLLGKAVMKETTEKALGELGEQVLTNTETIKSGAELAKKGTGLIDYTLDLLKGMKEGVAREYLENIPKIGPKIGQLIDAFLEVLPKLRSQIANNANTMSEVAEVAVEEGLDEVATGALTVTVTASTQAEKKAAQETLEFLAKENPALAAASKQLGLLDDAFNVTTKVTGQSARILTQAEKQVIQKSFKKFGPEVSEVLMKGTDDLLRATGTAGVNGAKASMATIYKALFGMLEDITTITTKSIQRTLSNIPVKERVVTFAANLGTGGGAARGAVTNIFTNNSGKLVVELADGTVREATEEVVEQLYRSGLMGRIFERIKYNISRQAEALIERAGLRQAQAAVQTSKQIGSEAIEQGAKEVLEEASQEATEEVAEKLIQDAGQGLTEAAGEEATEKLVLLLSPEAYLKSGYKSFVDTIGGVWKVFLSGLDVSGKTTISRIASTQSSDYYNVPREKLR